MAEYQTQIQKLEVRLHQLKLCKQRSDARRRALESKRTRREDNRRKLLVGAAVLTQVELGALEIGVLRRWLDQTLTRADERALFGL